MKIRLRNPGWLGFRNLFITYAIFLVVFMVPISFTLSWGVAVLYLHDRGLVPEDGSHNAEFMVMPPAAFLILIYLAVVCEFFVGRKKEKSGLIREKIRVRKDVAAVDDSHLDQSWGFPK
jgi:hypothetical protein